MFLQRCAFGQGKEEWQWVTWRSITAKEAAKLGRTKMFGTGAETGASVSVTCHASLKFATRRFLQQKNSEARALR
jgi:hypothetical protein